MKIPGLTRKGAKKELEPVSALEAANAARVSDLSNDDIDELEERLQRLEDEESWEKSHTGLVLRHNFSSFPFYLLIIASCCFASLNALHGYNGAVSQGTTVALAISALYFAIELTIPASSHMISWSGQGASTFLVRTIGLVSFCLAVFFSLLILQGKFSSSSETASRKSDIIRQTTRADQSSITQAISRRKELLEKKSRPVATVEAEILAHKQLKTCGRRKRSDCWRGTSQCTNATAKSSRAYCDVYARLLGELGVAKELVTLDNRIEKLKVDVTTRDDVVDSGQQDKIISTLTGIQESTVHLLKPSLLATVAALITHILWAGHGMVVNGTIVKKRAENLEKQRIRRKLDKAGTLKQTAELEAQRKAEDATALEERRQQEQTRQAFAEKKVQAISATAPLHERPLYMQVEAFIAEKCSVSDGLLGFLGEMHDEYSFWAQQNRCQQVPVARFKEILDSISFSVSNEGRVSGIALKTRATGT